MRYLLFIPLLFSLLFAWPTGTSKTMRIIVNSSRVNETATSFLHQLNLSDSIAKIDSLIDSTKHVAVVLPDGSTLKPKDVVYVAGKKFLIYWDGAKRTTSNDTFYLCFGTGLNTVSSTAAYSNPGYGRRWGFDKISGTTVYDDLGTNNGTLTSVDTAAVKFGVGGIFNASSDNVNCGNLSILNAPNKLSCEFVVSFDDFASYRTPIIAYVDAGNSFFVQLSTTVLQIAIGSFTGSLTLSGNLSTNTLYHFALIVDLTQSTNANRMKLFVNGVSKTLSYSGTAPAALGNLSTTPFYMGYPSTYTLRGKMDEVGICASAQSAGCVLDRYRVLFEPSTFYTIGPITKVKKKSTGNNRIGVSVGTGL